MRRAFDWMFRDPKTGKIVTAQWPNLPLWLYIAATIVRRLIDGPVGRVAGVLGTIALLRWAGDELIRGSARWRRILGAAVIVLTLRQMFL